MENRGFLRLIAAPLLWIAATAVCADRYGIKEAADAPPMSTISIIGAVAGALVMAWKLSQGPSDSGDWVTGLVIGATFGALLGLGVEFLISSL